MTVNLILFFLAGPIILAIGNLILGPIFNKKIPFRIQMRSFIVSTIIYLICAGLLYHFFLSSKF
ncbi:hypothetical protein [Staphylococcus kloosii]|jgi:uncharacterized membrane protein YcaP (DUF421 family)|uniref:Uncharacterized protein n=1 Tax=Staphylococcus kloosii TaxID=29384 RepID=A0A921KVH3_9STAP|nr:hypothetical protein [Staphylococcus kloosii]AVQ35444.1 hypothetical protein C7J89_04495 [Staphylococcus kloosii]PNZ04637.1 hypothetical protein CD136_08800 [Staphylococcus kloosii]PTJ73423.1 hypothetical protein BUZ59_12845 [Staphylococcus kloosii]SUM48495.1 membrane protein [Staphylococcus kloosii]GEP83361.1 hypothetical protein SKL01_25390 [Staphylococcus kloosii]